MTDKQRQHATGHTQVRTYVPTAFDEVADGPSLVEVQLTETFSGDIEGEAPDRRRRYVAPRGNWREGQGAARGRADADDLVPGVLCEAAQIGQ